MPVHDEQRNIPPFKDPTYKYRKGSKDTMAKLLRKEFGYCNAIYTEFGKKKKDIAATKPMLIC